MAEKRIPTGKAESRVRSELRLDYTTYRFSKKEIAQYAAMYLMLDAAISYLFFYSPIAFFVLLPGLWPFLKEQKVSLKRKRESEMRRQFLDGIQMTSASLQAGYSVENAFREAAGELTRIYKEDEFILREFRILSTQMEPEHRRSSDGSWQAQRCGGYHQLCGSISDGEAKRRGSSADHPQHSILYPSEA